MIARICAVIASGFVALVLAAQEPPEERALVETQRAFARAIARAKAYVVTIETLGGTQPGGGKLFGDGAQPINPRAGFRQAVDASTTGIVVRADGLIATSLFTFATEPSVTTVVAADGKEYVGKLVGRDFSKGLALVKIDAAGLAVAPVAARCETGQWALALGRAYASGESSAHVGILSATNRISGKALQTDAPTSPVNYGGPLIDLAGDVLGVIVPLSQRGSGIELYDSGIGFAIPLADVLKDVPILLKMKELHPGFLGVMLDPEYTGVGAKIKQVVPNTAAARAQLQAGDVITEVDGKPIESGSGLMFEMGRLYEGSNVVLTYVRGDKTLKHTAALGRRPEKE